MGDKVIPVKVAVRIRPLVPKEINEGCQSALEVVEGEPQVHIANIDKSFTYDYAYPGNSTNQQVYEEAVKGLLQKLFEGYNVTVLAYGQTGSGKTHSMGTAYKADIEPDLEGVIPRAVRDIFQIIGDKTDTEYIVRVSFLELYNEQLFDLLSSKPRREDSMVDIREDGKGGIKIPGLTETPTTSLADTMSLLEKSSEGRVTAATAMNARSSRSHAIFTLTIEAKPGPGCSNQGITMSKFHLVDLAGSERQKKTKAQGDRLKEGININMGLLSLGNVIAALGDEKRGPDSHIPYRDSKLTRLLQDSLGGNSHTLMVACTSPADSNLEETISTLRYADRARKIKNKPIVNKDPKTAELNRLRSQVQQLQMQVLAGGGAANVSPGEDSAEAKAENRRLVEENEKLNSALQSAMEENAHINEKLIMSELANERLKEKLAELEESALRCLEPSEDNSMEQKEMLTQLKKKVTQVREMQLQEEKTIMDHDITRFSNVASNGDVVEDGEDNLLGTTQTLKQSELATQLNSLNKELIAKQQLIETVGESDVKLAAMKKKYEEVLKSMEEEMGRLQKEKDELAQAQKKEGAGGVKEIAERRRKKIQELEEKINDLKKKQLEQQRLANMAKQNEAKAKKYKDEIVAIKAAKVKLVKQMKEESERVRIWKQGKEKEVIQLKQADRMKQVALSKMSVDHERKQNVLKRRMEEVLAINKRLKDAQEKKANVRQMKAGAVGLNGAGERVRGWVKSEIDVVVSAKEAELARTELIKERKQLTEEITKMKDDLRRTMTGPEMAERSARQAQLQEQLDMRNVQISELQKEILLAEQDKEKYGDRWSKMTSMNDAKLAISYLFNSATESMASVHQRQQEVRELRTQIEDLLTNSKNLKEKLSQQKMNHETEICRMERESEKNVLVLLNQMYNGDDGNETKDMSMTKDIVDKMLGNEKAIERALTTNEKVSSLQEEVERLQAELVQLRSGGSSNVFLQPPVGSRPTGSVKKNRRVTIMKPVKEAKPEVKYTEEEFFEEFEESDTSSEEDSTSDEEWGRTPMGRRIKSARKSLAAKINEPKRKRKNEADGATEGDETEDDGNTGKPSKKKSSISGGCGCKAGCKTKACSCRKAGPYCTATCKCVSNKCSNREEPGSDCSINSAIDTDKENEMNGDDTDSLLNSTFELPGKKTYSNSNPSTPENRTPLGSLLQQPIFKTPNSGADMFANDSDVEATPIVKAPTSDRIFNAPAMDCD